MSEQAAEYTTRPPKSINKGLSDRQWERTVFTLFGWCCLAVAAISAVAAVIAHLWK
jgi:hypothetical protein